MGRREKEKETDSYYGLEMLDLQSNVEDYGSGKIDARKGTT